MTLRIEITAGRMQPYALWDDRELRRFFEDARECARYVRLERLRQKFKKQRVAQ